MKKTLFRKNAIDRLASPEQLNDYIHVSNPAAWMSLAAFTILLVGICIWGIFGTLDTTVSVVAVRQADGIVCYVKEADRPAVQQGMPFVLGEETGSVTAIEKTPLPVGDSLEDYAKYIGGLADGEWVYVVHTDCTAGTEGEIFPAEIIVEQIHPLSLVTN